MQEGSREELFKKRQAAKTGGTHVPNSKQGDSKPAEQKEEEPAAAKGDSKPSSTAAVKINRAPVLTLW